MTRFIGNKEAVLNELYILHSSGKGLLRDGLYCYPCDSRILIQGAFILGSNGNCFPTSHNSRPVLSHTMGDTKLVFLELSFDPINRIKRGKFYKLAEEGQPATIYPSSMGGVYQVGSTSSQHSIQAYKFVSYDLTRGFNPRDTFIIFGNSRFETRWRVLSIDSSVTNEEVCVLQEVNSIGSIPTLNKNVIPDRFFLEIDKEYTSLLAELNSSPESVIDHCRDVATSLLSAVVGTVKKEDRIDLGKLILSIDDKYRVVKSSAEIINRLHPRRKPNEREKLELSELTRVESDFSVQCVFQIIRELKWNLK